ncbi:MAG: acetolactate synthase small subunit, partial [Calditrichaeota bacterium]|nr:acetolactate synthase small subunit [Calditrichota bacterium]
GRELVLVRVNCPPAKRGDVYQVVEIFGARVVDISQKTMTMEIVGPEEKIDAFLETMRPFGIKEVARTGPIAMLRESKKKL